MRTAAGLSIAVWMLGCSGGTSNETGPRGDGGSPPNDSGSPASDGATGEEGGTSTAGVECTYAYSGFNSSASVMATSTVAWSCSGTTRSMTANGIPDHDTGTFPNPNCPNTISAQTVSATMPLFPGEHRDGDAACGIVGYAFNGVKFDPSTAGTCSSATDGGDRDLQPHRQHGTWNIEALGQSSFNFGVDDNNAHVQPTGAYHYHGMPDGGAHEARQGRWRSTLVGFALDGFPVYARYGYTTPTDATSAVKVMKGELAAQVDARLGPPARRPRTRWAPSPRTTSTSPARAISTSATGARR